MLRTLKRGKATAPHISWRNKKAFRSVQNTCMETAVVEKPDCEYNHTSMTP